MSNLHARKSKGIFSKKKKLSKYKIKSAVLRNEEGTPGEEIPVFSETFLVGNLADLLFEIKSLARSSVNAKSAKIKEERITKLIALLGRYHNLLGNRFRQIIAVFIRDTFKSLHVPRRNFKEIEAWWLKM